MKRKLCGLAALVSLAACGGQSATEPPPTDPQGRELPENSGLVTTPGVKPACVANVSKLASSPPAGQPPQWKETMRRPRLISGSEMPILPLAQLPYRAEIYIFARCVLHREGNVADCNFICSYPGVDEAVLENLRERRYIPVMTPDGVPVDTTYTFQFHIVGQ